MKESVRSVQVKLLGEKITLKTMSNDIEVADQALKLVATLLEAAEKKAAGRLPQNQVLLLALLELAADHVKAKKRSDQFFSELDQKLEDIISEQSHSGSNQAAHSDPA